MFKRIVFFLFLNFVGLAIGSSFTGNGVSSVWYQNLAKAPWTPPGWVFGVAWSSIMICFAIFMAYLTFKNLNPKKVYALYAIQWVLNVAWNPAFFFFEAPFIGLLIISLLTIVVAYFLFKYRTQLQYKSLFVAPYFIWLLVATSLNAYILYYN